MDADSMHLKGDQSPTPQQPVTPPAKPEPSDAPHSSDTSTAPSEPSRETPRPSNQFDTPARESSSPNTPGVVTLQWLTYAFWGWLSASLVWLTAIVVSPHNAAYTAVPYAIAATVVLLPLAFVCDLFYRKHEPLKKRGAAMVIMVVHAVLFALASITSLIVAVFVGISLLVDGYSSNSSETTTLIFMVVSALLFAGIFVRTLNPAKSKKLATTYSYGLLVVSAGLLTMGVIGPLAHTINTRSDRLIENNLSTISGAINQYITDNNALPTSLSAITVTGEGAQSLINDSLVEYRPGSPVRTRATGVYAASTDFRYTLCVTYKAASANNDTSSYQQSDSEYSSYPRTYTHQAGRTCYNLQETVYGQLETSSKQSYNQPETTGQQRVRAER